MALSSAKRREVQEGVSGKPSAAADAGTLKSFPAIVAYLTETAWDDGKARQTATLMIFAEDGRWKVMLNDRDAGAVAFVSGDDVRACLTSLEKGLEAGTLDWRASRATQGKGKGR